MEKRKKTFSERVRALGKHSMIAEQYNGPFEDSDHEFGVIALSCTGGINSG